MIEAGLLALALYWLWEIRRALGFRTRPRFVRRLTPSYSRADFRGAIPPNRFVVIRWPDGLHLYGGCLGAKAREAYDAHHPAIGEEIELWELDACRGSK
jgi:hypothetical protein